jgi:molybdopterin molybdotransferase
MTQLSADCFASSAPLMTLAQALSTLETRIEPVVGSESVDLRVACRRILAEDVTAPRDLPPADNAAVDGYAVRARDLEAAAALIVVGRAAAGHPFSGVVGRGQTVRIFTGAPMPDGCDTVVMQEDAAVDGGSVVVPATVPAGANRRRAGEDLAAGQLALERGRRLEPHDVALAAALGRRQLVVYRPLRVAVFSTGDELHEPGDDLPPGGIYDANRHALTALLERLGAVVTDLGILPDDVDVVRTALADAAAAHDVVVTSGGMSVGEEDHVKAAIAAIGSLHAWQLAIKPGRPIGLGRIGDVPFIGLPGNPVAMIVTFLRVARPLLLRLAGCRHVEPRLFRVRAGFAAAKKAGRREFVRVRLETGADGEPTAFRFPRQGSGVVSSLVDSEGVVELAENVTAVAAGDRVDFLPFAEVLR